MWRIHSDISQAGPEALVKESYFSFACALKNRLVSHFETHKRGNEEWKTGGTKRWATQFARLVWYFLPYALSTVKINKAFAPENSDINIHPQFLTLSSSQFPEGLHLMKWTVVHRCLGIKKFAILYKCHKTLCCFISPCMLCIQILPYIEFLFTFPSSSLSGL